MIVDCSGGYCGRKNDHMIQDDSLISTRLANVQIGQNITYITTTDKGMHNQPCLVAMYNNLINTPAQDLSNTRWSPMRVSNETGIGLVNSTWKYCDYYKVLNTTLQPLGIFYRVCNILTNAITCLDENNVGKMFDCTPPLLEEYFA
jgi:hypothetical protein